MSSVVKYHLKQETPMWHFQCRSKGQQYGAILRGSDVKPRLDGFLINQMKENGVSWDDFKISPDHDALNYKIQIRAKGSPVSKNMGKKAFFANMGNDIDEEFTVFYPDGVDLKIICFIPELMNTINEHIEAFFLFNNFGTRSDKGFGSFCIDKIDNANIVNIFNNYKKNEHCFVYRVDTKECDDSNILDSAYILYQWMKSGLNYGNTYKKSLLTEYMLQSEIGGEKRWMKEKGIGPKVKKDGNGTIILDERKPSGKVSDYRYIRAVLGVSGNQSWVTDKKNKYGKNTRQDIAVSSEQIDRFQSPITIKVINDKLYFIAYDLSAPSRKDIFDKEFSFKNTSTGKTGSLKTLQEFCMKTFIEFCASEVKNKSFSFGKRRYQFEIISIE